MDYIENFVERRIRLEKQVQSEEYKDWLVEFTLKHPTWFDDEFLYEEKNMSEKDYENTKLLSVFEGYLDRLAKKQLVYPQGDEFAYIFKLRNHFYEIKNIYGQGTVTLIKELKEISEDMDYIKVDEEVTQEELEERELVQYIIINKDLIGKISNAKIGVHIGHACTIAAIKESNTEEFDMWYEDGKLQKKIVLVANTKKLEQLEKNFYSIRDLGFTEVEPNTLIAVSLGIMTRKKAKPYIKRLQTWKDY